MSDGRVYWCWGKLTLVKKELSLVTELIEEALDLPARGVTSPGRFATKD